MRITLAETQIETAQNVANALESQTADTVVVIFDEPIIECREYATIERFRLQFSKDATVEEIKRDLAQGIRDNHMRWNRTAFRKALAFLASQDED